ncbi:ABC transporter ATP-binding protein [Stutzerimonas nosocomialis]|uniref:ABC transporter ATP-binding protein n=1 Tax=Stutzerimonas nosocomialis TaxID=1056496 RepID=A0A5R9QEZ0_9GAMM|nr:ABC transporter ATP-binding protein [Stutzerimonas nosocomialis]TLX63717.1 ABC transporter ATP-binding protein [Stutzerimonas nosocomialis]
MLRTEALGVGYGGQTLLGPLDLELKAGRMVCLLGANGAGKSTLIRTLTGMQPATAGRVLLDGVELHALGAAERARQLAVVLTDRVEAGLLTGFELAALGRYPHLGWSGRLGPADRRQVCQALEAVDAMGLAGKAMAAMSDGERQRIMLARALAQAPKVLLLDEITAFLDLPRRIEVLHLLQRLAREQRLAVLLSCHDLDLALRCADVLWLLDSQRQMHVGAPEDLVLDGSLGKAFLSSGLRFDSERGEWGVARAVGKPVRLVGEGQARTWALRALERIGFHEAGTAELTVQVEPGVYRLLSAGREQAFARLGELVEAVEALR